MTAPYRDKQAWLAERRTGLGGSDAAVVLGVSPYKTLRQLWLEKTGQVQDSAEPTGPMLRGTYLEPVAADLYVEQTGRKVRRQPMRRHPDFDWMIGNVDRQILSGTAGVTKPACLEIKCPGLRVMADVKAHGLPDHMVIQLMWYLGVLGYSWGSFALFNSEQWGLVYFDLEADRQLIDTLIARGLEFWTKYVIPRVEPPSEAAKAVDIPQVEGELTIVDNDEWRSAATELREARELKDAAEALEETAKTRFQEMMHRQEVQALEVPGILRAYYKWMHGTMKWKETAAAIARAANLSVDDYIVKGEGFKRFSTFLLRERTED